MLVENIENFYTSIHELIDEMVESHMKERIELFTLKNSVEGFIMKEGKRKTEKRIKKLWKKFLKSENDEKDDEKGKKIKAKKLIEYSN